MTRVGSHRLLFASFAIGGLTVLDDRFVAERPVESPQPKRGDVPDAALPGVGSPRRTECVG